MEELLLRRKSYIGVCCWCQGPAKSGEHIFKKTDVKRLFSMKNESQPILIHRRAVTPTSPTNRLEHMQGANSELVKFSHVLCADCNGSKSQPFDLAYSRFSQYWYENRRAIVHDQKLDFSQIFGSDWENQCHNLGKYFLKHVACRLADSGFEVPGSLTAALGSDAPDFRSVHLGFRIDRMPDYLSESIAAVSGEPFESMMLGDFTFDSTSVIEPNGGSSSTVINGVSSTMSLGTLTLEWMLAYEEMRKPFNYAFRHPVYMLKRFDSMTREDVQQMVEESGFLEEIRGSAADC